MPDPRHPFEQKLRYRFADPALLTEALTHRGAPRQAKKPAIDNERLEFLGDRVLGLTIAETLLREFPKENEGALAQRLASLVSAPSLARIGHDIGLAEHLQVASGQNASDGETAVLADACEAVIGALYLDGGLPAAAAFIDAHWKVLLTEAVDPPKDAKTALQEWAQARGLPLPVYTVVTALGPAHAPSFKISVALTGHPEVEGEGRTKRLAEQSAAARLLAIVKDVSA